MKSFVKITIPVNDSNQSGLLVAQLTELGFDGFEETENELFAFIEISHFDEQPVSETIHAHGLDFSKVIIEPVNWNSEWEQHFQPIQINDFCLVRAAFHTPVNRTRYEVVITPKMSFGTGHHATTFMMIAAMEHLDLVDKKLLDFGTGTGLLAILAEKCGARRVLALDNDPVCVENSLENISVNHCQSVTVEIAEQIEERGFFDVIMANINRNILIDHFEEFRQHLTKEGVLLLSGLLENDFEEIVKVAKEHGFALISRQNREGWICLEFNKNSRIER